MPMQPPPLKSSRLILVVTMPTGEYFTRTVPVTDGPSAFRFALSTFGSW